MIQVKQKIAVIVGEDLYHDDGYDKFVANHITDWLEVTQEEFVAVANWCSRQYGSRYKIIRDVTSTLDINEIMKEAIAEQAKRDKAEALRKAKALASKAAKKKLKEEEKRSLYEQLKKELGE
jgi:hypothetical protein